MSALLIKNFPVNLHQKIRKLAKLHHRSMNQEAVVLLKEAIEKNSPAKDLGSIFKGEMKLTQAFLNKAKSFGRA